MISSDSETNACTGAIFQGNEKHRRSSSEEDSSDSGGKKKKKKRKVSVTVNTAFARGAGYVRPDMHGNYSVQAVSDMMQAIMKRWKCPRNIHMCCTPSETLIGGCESWSHSQIQEWAQAIVSSIP